MQCIDIILLAIIKTRQSERSFISLGFSYVFSQYGLYRPTSPLMHAIVKFKITDSKFGLSTMPVKTVQIRLIQRIVLAKFYIKV